MAFPRKHLALATWLLAPALARAQVATAPYAGGSEAGVLAGGAWQRPAYKSNGFGFGSVSYTGFAGGAYVQQALAPQFSVEVGAFYARRVFTPNFSLQHRASVVELPVLARVWIVPKYLSLGAGAYFAAGLGDITISTGFTNYPQTYAVAGYRRFEFGLAGSLQGRVPVSPNLSALLDLRGLLGLLNQKVNGNSLNNTRYRELQVLAGLGCAF